MEGRPSWEHPEYVVTVQMNDGETHTEKARVPFIAPIRVVTKGELVQKYHDCAGLVVSEDDVKKSLEILEDLEHLSDINLLSEIIGKGHRA
jgi:hypothetical protein